MSRLPKNLIMPEHMVAQLSQEMLSERNAESEKVRRKLMVVFLPFLGLWLLVCIAFLLFTCWWCALILMICLIIVIIAINYFYTHRNTQADVIYINQNEIGKINADGVRLSIFQWKNAASHQDFDSDVSYSPGGRYSPSKISFFSHDGRVSGMNFCIEYLIDALSPTKNSWELRRLVLAHFALSASEPLILDRSVLIMAQIDPMTWQFTRYPKYIYNARMLIHIILILLLTSLVVSILVVRALNWIDYLVFGFLLLIFIIAPIVLLNNILEYFYPIFECKSFQFAKNQNQ